MAYSSVTGYKLPADASASDCGLDDKSVASTPPPLSLLRFHHHTASCCGSQVADARPAGSLLNVNGLVDQAYEAATLNELLAAPPSALQGLRPK